VEPRHVLLVTFRDVQSLDVTWPLEVFTGAARLVPRAYRVTIAGPGRDPLRTNSGLTLVPESR